MPINKIDFKQKVMGKIKEKFEVEEILGKPHVYYEIWHEGRKVAVTHCSHGEKKFMMRFFLRLNDN